MPALLAPAHAQVSSAIQTPPMKDEVCADIVYENIIKLKLSGIEVYYTAHYLLAKSKNSCGKLHCQIIVNNSRSKF